MDGGVPTVREVAAKAGCSTATVSRVVTGNGPVSGPMQKRVVRAALQLGSIASLRRIGLRVPDDVSVTGFDGIDIARHMSPRLTTVVQPSRTMGVLAASMVLGIAHDGRPPCHPRADVSFTPGETIAPYRRDRRPFSLHSPAESIQP